MTVDAADPWIGRVIAGRYELLSRVGRGGMGAVYAARHLAMKRSVAVKLLHAEMSRDPTIVGRFEREAQLASVLTSPRVVTLFDFGRDADGTLFLVMELLDGETLGERIRRVGALPLPEALEIAACIAEALSVAHERGVVHRDLKPDNVMLTSAGPKVLDFGIARIVEGDSTLGESTLTQSGQIVGTPMYMSPEAAGRKPVGPPADLYALGCVVFEMVSGRPPFAEEESVLVMGMHLRVLPELVSAVSPQPVPVGLDELVDQLLAKRPEERGPSADHVAHALRALTSAPLGQRAASAASSSPPRNTKVPPTRVAVDAQALPTPTPSATPRRRVAWGLVGVSLVAVASFTGVYFWPSPRPARPVAAPATATPAASDTPPRQAPVTPPPLQADGRVTVRVSVEPAGAPVAVRWGQDVVTDLTPCTDPNCTWTFGFEVDRSEDARTLSIDSRGYERYEARVTPSDDRLVYARLARARSGRRREARGGPRGLPSTEAAFGSAP